MVTGDIFDTALTLGRFKVWSKRSMAKGLRLRKYDIARTITVKIRYSILRSKNFRGGRKYPEFCFVTYVYQFWTF